MAKDISCGKISARIGACANATKYIMGICFSLIFALGVILAIICCVALADAKLLGDFDIKNFRGVMILGLILGLFLAIVAILGAIGYFSLNRCLLLIVIIVFFVLALAQIICGALGLVYKDKYETPIQSAWNKADEDDRKYVEEHLHCCGGANSTDRPASPHCLGNESSSHSVVGSSSSDSYADGCVSKLAKEAKDMIVSVGAGLIVVTIFELVVVGFTIFLFVKISGAHSYYQVHEEDALEVLQG